jgi:pimeloyl-ACP methyl ester carboxylesterase
MQPATRYARSGDVNIAYQVVGDGPLDLVVVPGWISNVEMFWEEPMVARFFRVLAGFSRLIIFDKRGTGLSDRSIALPTLEDRMDDVRAVLDAVGSERAALFGYSEGGPMCALFAATYPERTTALIMYGAYAKRLWSTDYPWAPTSAEREAWYASLMTDWGGPVDLTTLAPSLAADDRFCQWWAKYLRLSASPGTAVALGKMNAEIDIRHILPAIRVPTLIVHRTGDRDAPVECGRHMAAIIPGAKYVELPGDDHLVFASDYGALLDEIGEFLTGMKVARVGDRVLATVMVTDIIGSTRLATELGDQDWSALLQLHGVKVRDQLARYRGVERNQTGDGFVATFDGPARAIRCARAIANELTTIGIDVRIGLHAGEVELIGDDVGGIAVHIAARIADLARGGEILISGTVTDLIAGSGIHLEDRGRHTLKGVTGFVRTFRVDRGHFDPLRPSF